MCPRILLLSFLLFLAVTSRATPPQETPDGWYRQGENSLQVAVDQKPVMGTARNVILFLGDGMGVTTVTASRILAGQTRGGHGEEHLLEFERFPYLAL
ncbi:MAG: alkaline phosphatase, partial [Terriglobales bacterium]